MRIFGCPAYVLSKEMQDGQPTGKFSKQRSYLGVFVGFSSAHAGSVPLIYNPDTKLTSPQYHVIFDEAFETVFSDSSDKEVQEQIFQSLTFLGDRSDEFEYSDSFEDNPSRQFFDDSWDIQNIRECLETRRCLVKRTLEKAL